MKKIYIFDTTLRDGTQGSGINFSLEDKLKIVKLLDDFGIDYIEGGWPHSNPKDDAFFNSVRKLKLKHAKIVAFGSTRKKNVKANKDPNLLAIVSSKADVACIFGKSWTLHVEYVLRTTYEENLNMIYDSVEFLKKHFKEVIYDAEHFFDGYKENSEYAIKTIEAAYKAGADNITLCDTNGGSLPDEVYKITKSIKEKFPDIKLGIHCHNDSGCAVANSIAAVNAGAILVQGTVNGFGERTGNTDILQVIGNLELKMGYYCVGKEKLKKMTELSREIYEIANITPNEKQPYTGYSAFAHKGGVHVAAVERITRSYEHVSPEAVGNE
ncbi:MAG: citramalate synthase, partial [bacterium]|nr:citramalate synthase [bacterium]